MASKSDRFYFENFIAASNYTCEAAAHLVKCLENYDPNNLKTMINEMHQIEHAGDIKKHELSATLAKAFVTPIDREDLDLISNGIDDITDKIEEVLQRFYIHSIKEVKQEVIDCARKIYDCCCLVKEIMVEFINFKKSKKLHDMIVNVNHLEEELDRIYLELMVNVKNEYKDILDIIAWREIYDFLENCADTCENTCDAIETVIMKNM